MVHDKQFFLLLEHLGTTFITTIYPTSWINYSKRTVV